MNLADDGQLLAMMKAANFFAIFMGIESPDAETLIATQKKQNTRRSLAESVHKIYGAGMFVIAGFIVGFDTEKGGMAAGMIDCIEASSIPACMVGLLTALPNTQLMRRLQAEKRLLPLVSEDGDQCLAGLNFVTLRARRDILEDYKTVLEAVYPRANDFVTVRCIILDFCASATPARGPFRVMSADFMSRFNESAHLLVAEGIAATAKNGSLGHKRSYDLLLLATLDSGSDLLAESVRSRTMTATLAIKGF